MQHEQSLTCPYCNESITMLLDASEGQKYIEDCEVCCRPIEVEYQVEGEEIVSALAHRTQ